MISAIGDNSGYQATAVTVGGAAAGAGAGLLVNTIKHGAETKNAKYLAGLTKDTFGKAESEFVSGAIKAAKESGRIKMPAKAAANGADAAKTKEACKKALESYKKVKKEATGKFKKLCEEAPEKLKALKNSKIKWVAGLAAAGLAVGAVAALIISKKNADKKAETAAEQNEVVASTQG